VICADIIGERCRLSPDSTAVVEVVTGARLTYRDMNHRAAATARAWLYGLGLKQGDRLGILAGNRLEFLDAFFAAAKSGVILVPLGTRLTAAELAVIVSDCELSALIYGAEHIETVRELAEQADVERLVALDGEGAEGDLVWDEVLASIGDGEYVPPVCQPDDPYCLLYTSGTTGRPKGVITPHRMVGWNAYNTVACWQLTEDDVSPIFTPLYHAGGLGAFLTPILLAGGTIVLHRDFDAAEVWRVIEEECCTVVLGVPTIWKMLADAPEFKTAELGHVRWFISGGAPMPRHLVGVFRDRGIVMRQGYGLTEVGVNCFAMSDEEAWARAGSIGRPLMFTEAKVVDEGGQELPPDEVGELCFRGLHVSAGYWNNPEASFTPETWPGVTRTVSSTSPAAPRTCSSRVGSTSTRRRSRTCSCNTPRSLTPRWSGCRTAPGARSGSPSWFRPRVRRSLLKTSAASSAIASRATRFQRNFALSMYSPGPRTAKS
jgi:fatty-acyl-CoA synthase